MSHTHRIPGLALTDHRFRVPLHHGDPGGPAIEVFAREVTAARGEPDLPWLVFLQGGPGFPAPRPTAADGWIGRAVRDYRVLLLDQRGTGRSTPMLAQTLPGPSTADQVSYLANFRADTIVRDLEQIRRELGVERWSLLGQSFGGFCATHYLSAAPDGLAEVMITGGLPPIATDPDDFYRATFRRVLDRNRRFRERYPSDDALVRRLARRLAHGDVHLPDGAPLSVRRLQQLGWEFGGSDGFEHVHYLLEDAFAGEEVSRRFLRDVWTDEPFESNPIYVLLHEACVCDGGASNWSAERVRGEFPELDPDYDGPLNFTGEHVFPWMFDEFPGLSPFRDAANTLAAYEWPALYDAAVLAKNTVPCAATIYYDDMYVERTFSESTAGAIRGLRTWVTNEFDHNGLRADGAAILDRLIAMVREER